MEKDNIKNNQESIKQFVTFSVAAEEYGLEIIQVQEVIRLPKITKLPRAPIFIKGVIDLRGTVIPVLDLREKFALEIDNLLSTEEVVQLQQVAGDAAKTNETVAV